jgi:hypothetical protein
MLCGSQSHILITFWKIFVLTVIFGLFQGIVLLPVLLCYIGPKEKKIDVDKSAEEGKTNQALEIGVTDAE